MVLVYAPARSSPASVDCFSWPDKTKNTDFFLGSDKIFKGPRMQFHTDSRRIVCFYRLYRQLLWWNKAQSRCSDRVRCESMYLGETRPKIVFLVEYLFFFHVIIPKISVFWWSKSQNHTERLPICG